MNLFSLSGLLNWKFDGSGITLSYFPALLKRSLLVLLHISFSRPKSHSKPKYLDIVVDCRVANSRSDYRTNYYCKNHFFVGKRKRFRDLIFNLSEIRFGYQMLPKQKLLSSALFPFKITHHFFLKRKVKTNHNKSNLSKDVCTYNLFSLFDVWRHNWLNRL